MTSPSVTPSRRKGLLKLKPGSESPHSPRGRGGRRPGRSFSRSSVSPQDLQHLIQTRDSAPGANLGALQRGGGIGKSGDLLQRPALQQTIDEGAVKDVAGSGGIGYGDLESRRSKQPALFGKHRAPASHRDAGNPAAIAIRQCANRLVGGYGSQGRARRTPPRQ